MSVYQRSIVSLIEPDFKNKIKLDELIMEDGESEAAAGSADASSSTNQAPNMNGKASSRVGAYIPMLAINSTVFKEDELQSMELSLEDKVPTIFVMLKDQDNKFATQAPLDGDVISLYLRPPDEDNQRPIRIDFNIITIDSNVYSRVYVINGVMKLPEFYKEFCKSFPSDTSFNHLQTLCEEVGIGFASNEEATIDTQPRICAYDTYETFVNDTVFTTYKDDDSFFDWYIDPYYYLCLVNVHKQFSLEDTTEDVNISSSHPTSGIPTLDNTPTPDSTKGSLILTNNTMMAEKNVYIERYTLKNKSGRAWLANGYKRYAQWFNVGESESTFEEVFVDPLTTPGSENDFILLKGRKLDGSFYSTMNKYKWLGKQAPVTEQGNVHEHYCFSKVLNHQNLVEITKTTLEVQLAGMNFYIYKYMRIPVTIYESNNPKASMIMQKRNEDLGEPNTDSDEAKNTPLGQLTPTPYQPQDTESAPKQNEQVKNEFLSGYYLVTSVTYTYDPKDPPIKMNLTLSRREWPIPAKNKDV